MCNDSIDMGTQNERFAKMSSYARRILQHKTVSQIATEDGTTEAEVNKAIEEIAQVNPSLYNLLKVKM